MSHTPGPWPWEYTGDGKRITIGEGLVCGPRGYEVAEVYSDDCDSEEAEANASLIAAAPEMLEALMEAHEFDMLGLQCPPSTRHKVIAAIAKARGAA